MSTESIKIKDALIARSQSEHYKKALSSSDFARGMYARARLNTKSVGAIICVFLDSAGKFLTEVFLSRDYLFPDWLVDKLLYYSAEYPTHSIFIARTENSDDDIHALCAGGVYIFDRLEINGIELLGYYNISTFGYVNLLPERHHLE